MTMNINPVFSLTPDVSNNNGTGVGATLLTATGDYTGVSANHVLEHTAGANGSYVDRLVFKAIGGNVQTVARVYLNNGSTHTTATNNSFFDEITLPQTTATNTQNTPTMVLPLGLRLPAGWTIWVGLATTVAAGWNCVAVAGQY